MNLCGWFYRRRALGLGGMYLAMLALVMWPVVGLEVDVGLHFAARAQVPLAHN